MYIHYDVSFCMIMLDVMDYMLELFDLLYSFECLHLDYGGSDTPWCGGSNPTFPLKWLIGLMFKT